MKKVLDTIESLKNWQGAALCFLLGFLVYANTLGHEYVWDDSIVIVQNPKVQEGIGGIPALFEKGNSLLISDQYGYRPVSLISFAVDYSIWGLNPLGGHLMNALFFALVCALIFLTVRRLFPDKGRWLPLLAAILFALHPLHVEAVANIKSRDEIFALLFGLLAIWSFAGFLRKGKVLSGIFTPVYFFLACLSKENAFTLIAVFPVVWLLLVDKKWKAHTRKLWPAAACVLALGLVFVLRLGVSESVSQTDGMGIYQEEAFLGNALLGPRPNSHQYSTGFFILGQYLKNFLVPYPLVYYAGFDQVPVTGWASPWVWLSFLLHLGLLAMAIWKFREWKVIAFGSLFYLLTISIYSQWLRPLSDAMADRFMFMPSLGLCLVLIGLIARIPVPRKLSFSPYLTALLLLGLVWGGLTLDRNQVWKDNYTLFEHDLPNLENCSRCQYYYASALERRLGEKGGSQADYAKVIEHYEKSLKVSSRAYYSHIKLGNLYLRLQQFTQAENVFKKASNEFPDQHGPLMYQAISLLRQNKSLEAIPLLKKAARLSPRNPETYYHLGRAYANTGALNQALETLEKGKSIDPAFAYYYDVEGDIFWDSGQNEAAFSAMKKALELEKGQAGLYNKIIGRSVQAGLPDQAERYKQLARDNGLGVK